MDIDTPERFSIKPVQVETVKTELQEHIWLDIGQNLANYVSKRVQALKTV